MSALKTDYTAEALDRLLSTLKGDDGIDALIAAFLDRCQELEDAAHPMLEQRSIDLAVGDRLDRIGSIVAVPRSGRGDEDYRLRLRAEIAILNSDGVALDIMNVLNLLVGGPSVLDISLDESFPKSVTLRARNLAHNKTGAEMDAILTLLRRAVTAATEVNLVYSNLAASDDNLFHFSTVADTTQAAATYGTESGFLAGAAI